MIPEISSLDGVLFLEVAMEMHEDAKFTDLDHLDTLLDMPLSED
jgi:hypothetical protein